VRPRRPRVLGVGVAWESIPKGQCPRCLLTMRTWRVHQEREAGEVAECARIVVARPGNAATSAAFTTHGNLISLRPKRQDQW
jgi:hypothetical protein